MSRIQTLLFHVALCAAFHALTGRSEGAEIADFDSAGSNKMDWQIEDDGVMGGLSRGKIDFSENGVLVFYGTLSLENDGGFSSVQTGRVDLDLSDHTGVELRVKGDGRTYQFRMVSTERYRGREVDFAADFATEEGKWTEVRIPFKKFTATFHGRELPDRKLDPAKVQRLRFLIGDKQPGAFRLEVDWIRSY